MALVEVAKVANPERSAVNVSSSAPAATGMSTTTRGLDVARPLRASEMSLLVLKSVASLYRWTLCAA